jgi:hypothetical protein
VSERSLVLLVVYLRFRKRLRNNQSSFTCNMECTFVFNAASCTLVLMFLVARWGGRQSSDSDATVLNTCRLSWTQCSTLHSLHLRSRLSFSDTADAARDWGRIKRLSPAGVLYPESVDDIVSLVRTAGLSTSNLTVAAKGRGHSINGQAQVALEGDCIAGRRFQLPCACKGQKTSIIFLMNICVICL